MKYMIKEVERKLYVDLQYAQSIDDINHARLFDSMPDVVRHLQRFPAYGIELTIVGVKETNQPRYEEIPL